MTFNNVKTRKMKLLIFLFGIFRLTFLVFPLDPAKQLTQYVLDTWGLEQGLPQSSVLAVTQTEDGYLWLGSEGGLVRFDGVRFKSYNKQLSNNWVTVLNQDREGNLWIGTQGGGLARFKNETFHVYTTAEGLSHDVVWAILEDPEKTLWIGTDGGLNRMKNGRITTYTTEQGLSHNIVRPIARGREGCLWIGTNGGGLNRMENGKFTIYTTHDGLSNNRVSALLTDRRGDLWIGTEDGGLNCLRKGKLPFHNYTTKDGLAGYGIRKIYEDREGNLWIGTLGGGLNRLQNGTFSTLTKKQGLSDNFIFSFFEDSEGSLWVGTWGGGLNRLKNGKFTIYTTHGGLSNDMVLSIYEDRNGYLWFSTDDGLNRMDPGDGAFTLYTKKHGLSSDLAVCVYEDRGGRLWVGTGGGGLNCIEDGGITSYTTKQGLSHGNIRSILEDREGNLWIGTWGGGLNRLKNGTFTAYTIEHGLSDNKIRHIYEDRKGNLWVGTDDGLSRLDHRGLKNGNITFTAFTTKDGLSHNTVRTIYEDREGDLWIGTYGGGLNRLKNGVFTPITADDGLFSNVVFHILGDEKENLWMSCNKGIFQVPLDQLKAFCVGKLKRVDCISYDDGDGMKSKECNGISQPSSLKDRGGKFWFPTKKGAVMLDPDNITINRLPPPVKIEKITADNVEIQPPFPKSGETLIISPGTERFEIEYTGLSFLAPRKVRFKCKLEGFDRTWRSVGTRRTAYYTKLPPGNYTFRVTACNNDGVWNEIGASVTFYLKPLFYQAWWFYILCALGALFFALFIYRFRVKQLTIRKTELERLVNERTKQIKKKNEENLKKSQALEKEHQKLKDTQSQLAHSEKMAGLGILVAGVAHEINNPTNFTHASAYNLERDIWKFKTFLLELAGDDADDEVLTAFDEKFDILFKHLDTLQEGTTRIKGIVEDLRTFSRLDESDIKHVKLLEGLKTTNNLVRANYRDQVEFVTDFRANPETKCYPAELNQVYMNLMMNACQAIIKKQKERKEEGKGTLTIQTLEEKDHAVIVFQDTGTGMSEEVQRKMFDPFFTTKEVGEGTGLGLSISFGIIEKHRGRIEVVSEEGKGTTVTLYLPLNTDNNFS